MNAAEYKQFNLWYWEREEDGSYTRKLHVCNMFLEASEVAFMMIRDIDLLDPEGPRYRLEKIEAVY